MPETPAWMDVDDFKTGAKDGTLPSRAGTAKAFGSITKAVDEQARTIGFVMSTGDVDRHRDTVAQDGWEWSDHVPGLWAHDHDEPALGKWVNIKSGARLEGDLQFCREGLNPMADMLWGMAVAGMITSCSVGFIPLEWTFVEDDDRPFGVDFKRQELLECSLVNVPANAGCVQNAKSAGMNVKPMVFGAPASPDRLYEIPSIGGGRWGRRDAAFFSWHERRRPHALD